MTYKNSFLGHDIIFSDSAFRANEYISYELFILFSLWRAVCKKKMKMSQYFEMSNSFIKILEIYFRNIIESITKSRNRSNCIQL